MLQAFGWAVEKASSGTDALNTLFQHDANTPFDIVYIDYHMTMLDGWRTSEQIRALNLKHPLILILMSRIDDCNQMIQFKSDKRGIIDGYLLKPVTPSSLFDAAANIYLPQNSNKPLALETLPILGRLNKFQILLVEDNQTNQVVAHDLLVSEGARVFISENASDVLDKINTANPFDVILMDIHLPGMDGYTLTKKIRKKY